MQAQKAYLVESIPVGMDDLRVTKGLRYTETELKRLTDRTKNTLDLTVMYWNLLPRSDSRDESGFSAQQFEAFGAGHGRSLYNALRRAARRGVKIRILQSRGFGEPGVQGPPDEESDRIVQEFPEQVQIRQINMDDWYGAGIMHQKIWVFDQKSIYIGSANMDWKSISQVKELGVVTENTPEIAEDVAKYFEVWWQLGGLSDPRVAEVYDPQSQVSRTVPAWSTLVPAAQRIKSPLAKRSLQTPYNLKQPLATTINGKKGGVFITGCPKEVCLEHRTYDGDGIVYTILDAQKTICISVMDFAPVSLYRGAFNEDSQKYEIDGKTATPVWWPLLFDALLQAVTTKGVQARLLISKWAHTSAFVNPYLIALDKAAKAGRMNSHMTAGRLEIRRFVIPGWDSTAGHGRNFPGHSRVNHTKYIVTDRRINIGTSNMTWDYFTNTAGSSFNSDHPDLLQKLQEIFDRDWDSQYAHLFKRRIGTGK
jgi:phospholipase D3/4